MSDKEIKETLSTYIARIEGAETPFENGLLLSRNVGMPVLLDGVDNKVVKTPVAWPLMGYNMFYVVDVPPDTTIPPHSHDEDLFRVLISGDLNINGVDIQIGEWFVVKSGSPYSIRTEGGYKSISAYRSICRTNRMSEMHLERTFDR